MLMQLAGEADEEEGWDDDGGLDSVKKILRLKADQVIGAVPWDGGVQVHDDASRLQRRSLIG